MFGRDGDFYLFFYNVCDVNSGEIKFLSHLLNMDPPEEEKYNTSLSITEERMADYPIAVGRPFFSNFRYLCMVFRENGRLFELVSHCLAKVSEFAAG